VPVIDPRLVAIIILLVAFLILVFIVVPLVGRFSLLLEALTLLSEPLGDLLGNQRNVLLGCFVLLLAIIACCIISFIIVGSLLTCGSANPSGLCHLVGR
jgi:hypothetical protein